MLLFCFTNLKWVHYVAGSFPLHAILGLFLAPGISVRERFHISDSQEEHNLNLFNDKDACLQSFTCFREEREI